MEGEDQKRQEQRRGKARLVSCFKDYIFLVVSAIGVHDSLHKFGKVLALFLYALTIFKH